MGFGAGHLAAHPELQEQLRGDPGAIARASKELLRYYAFVGPMRVLTQDHELDGVSLKQGDTVQLFTPASGYDASAYPDPERFDPDREGPQHLAFAFGPHYCLGAHLARLELDTIYEVMLDRLPTFRLDPDHPPTYHGGIIAGVSSLHLVWDR